LTEEEYEKYLIWCLAWALGGVYEVPDRLAIQEYFWSKGFPLPPKGRENETIYDYYIETHKGTTTEWKLNAPDEWKPPEKLQFSQILIPTTDSFRAEILLNAILL
jgi:dynein heavy chain